MPAAHDGENVPGDRSPCSGQTRTSLLLQEPSSLDPTSTRGDVWVEQASSGVYPSQDWLHADRVERGHAALRTQRGSGALPHPLG